MEVARTYRELLRNGPLARLLIGEFVSSIGDWLYLVALVVLVYRETQDPVILGIIGAARMLPYIFLSIPAGIITDRFDRRLVLLTSDIARGLCMLVLAYLVYVDGPLWSIGAVAILAACFSTFFYPAIGALLPSLARDEREFGPANSAWATLDNFAWIVGPGVAGLLLATGELTLAFLLNAATFGVIAVVLWSLPRAVPLPAPKAAATAECRRGRSRRPAPPRRLPARARPPGRHPDLGLLGVGALARVAGSVPASPPASTSPRSPASPSSARSRGSPSAASASSSSSSRRTCSTAATRRPGTSTARSASAARSARCCRGRSSCARGSGGCCSSRRSRSGRRRSSSGSRTRCAIAFVAIIIASVGNLVTDVTGTTIFQRAVPDAYRGRLGGVMMTGQTGSEALGTLVLPILVSVFGFGLVLGVTGALVVALTAVAVALIGSSADVPAGPYDADLKRIARLPLFGGLSPARVEQALRRLDPVDATAGDVILRQGDPADRFYVICGGTFAVTQVGPDGGEPRLLRTLTQDDVFGERGIIAGAPRAATITAETDGRLFTMDGADFLELVGGRKGMAERFLALYESPTESRGRS